MLFQSAPQPYPEISMSESLSTSDPVESKCEPPTSELRSHRHPVHYTVDEGIVFFVEGKLYRVPKAILVQSEFFQGMFLIPPSSDDGVQEGSSDERPISPDGVTSLEIESLLDLLKAKIIDSPPTFSHEQLCAILYRATVWSFEKAREYAIKEIDKKLPPPIDRIELAFKCTVSKWLKPAYEQLCTRSDPLTLEEARRLGMSKYYALSQIRESRRNITGQLRCGSCSRNTNFSCSNCGNYYNQSNQQQQQPQLNTDLDKYRAELDLGAV